MFKGILKKISGVDKIETEALSKLEEAKQLAEDARKTLEEERKLLKESKKKIKEQSLSPKELANKKKEPYFDIVKTYVDPANIRHGFFEMDWNDYFIEELIKLGYGLENDKQEDIVDRWYREFASIQYQEMGISVEHREFGLLRHDLNEMTK